MPESQLVCLRQVYEAARTHQDVQYPPRGDGWVDETREAIGHWRDDDSSDTVGGEPH